MPGYYYLPYHSIIPLLITKLPANNVNGANSPIDSVYLKLRSAFRYYILETAIQQNSGFALCVDVGGLEPLHHIGEGKNPNPHHVILIQECWSDLEPVLFEILLNYLP